MLCVMVQKRLSCKSSVDINYISKFVNWKLSACTRYKYIYKYIYIYTYTYVLEIWKDKSA